METTKITGWLKVNSGVILISIGLFCVMVFGYDNEVVRPIIIFSWLAATVLWFISYKTG